MLTSQRRRHGLKSFTSLFCDIVEATRGMQSGENEKA